MYNVREYKEEDYARVREMEEIVDRYEDALGSYLVKLNNRDLSQRDSRYQGKRNLYSRSC